jgi:hypothetical protein
LEFDESDPDQYLGERNVLSGKDETLLVNEQEVFGREPK